MAPGVDWRGLQYRREDSMAVNALHAGDCLVLLGGETFMVVALRLCFISHRNRQNVRRYDSVWST